jgi:chemotaxis protein MotA
MNIFTILSFFIAIGVLLGGFYLASPELHLFLDYPSMFIVLGGTFAATAISFKLNKIFVLIKVYLMRVIKGKPIHFAGVVTEVIKAIDEIKKGKNIKDVSGGVKDYFFKESLELINDGLLSQEEIIEVLELRNIKLTTIYKKDCDKMRAIGKFPPAFGMIGTTIGMIVLLANLGGEDAMKMIGPAMGVCLITTLYGASLANIFLVPMAENLTENTKETYSKNEIIIEGTKLILEKANPILAAEKLNSFLTPSDRVDWKKIIK